MSGSVTVTLLDAVVQRYEDQRLAHLGQRVLQVMILFTTLQPRHVVTII